jgi:hypothetical protein
MARIGFRHKLVERTKALKFTTQVVVRIHRGPPNLTNSGRVNTCPSKNSTSMREWVACSALGLIWPSPDHSRITHSRKQTVPRGHRRTRRPRHLSTGGPQRSRQDTRGHDADTVRDREDEGSNPSPPTIFVFKIGDFRVTL